MSKDFCLHHRAGEDWDIWSDKERLFKIRQEEFGENYVLFSEKTKDKPVKFKTLTSCMSYVCDLLMKE